MAGFGGIKKVKCAAAKPVVFCLCKKRIYSAICFAASFCNITYFPFLGKLQAMLIVHRAMKAVRFQCFRIAA